MDTMYEGTSLLCMDKKLVELLVVIVMLFLLPMKHIHYRKTNYFRHIMGEVHIKIKHDTDTNLTQVLTVHTTVVIAITLPSAKRI